MLAGRAAALRIRTLAHTWQEGRIVSGEKRKVFGNALASALRAVHPALGMLECQRIFCCTSQCLNCPSFLQKQQSKKWPLSRTGAVVSRPRAPHWCTEKNVSTVLRMKRCVLRYLHVKSCGFDRGVPSTNVLSVPAICMQIGTIGNKLPV